VEVRGGEGRAFDLRMSPPCKSFGSLEISQHTDPHFKKQTRSRDLSERLIFYGHVEVHWFRVHCNYSLSSSFNFSSSSQSHSHRLTPTVVFSGLTVVPGP
jgi:hypothetical protein